MFPNSPLRERHSLLRSADALLGALTIAGLGLAASLIGLIFVGLLPIIGTVLLIAVVVRAVIEAASVSPACPGATAPLRGARFAH